jgi:hypothetical protein
MCRLITTTMLRLSGASLPLPVRFFAELDTPGRIQILPRAGGLFCVAGGEA